MPHSEKTFDKKIREFLRANPASQYVDIGPGAGKYGNFIRLALPGAHAHITAVEAHEPYVKEFGLHKIYDKIHIARAEDFFFEPRRRDFQTDIVIMGDVLEHLRKSAGVDLINYFFYRTRFQVIVYPTKLPQFSVGGVQEEAHISVWGEGDFLSFDHSHQSDFGTELVIIPGLGGAG